jgi:alkaline phosphatase
MMVEGGKIDWVCHANDAGAMVHEVIDFSEAVDAAIEFYHEHPEETLIIVTADHETGGLGMGSNLMKYETDYALLGEQQLSGEAFNKVTAEWLKENKLDEEGFDAMLSLLGETFGIGGEGAPIPLSKEELSVMKDAFMELGKTQEGEYGDYTRLTYLATKLLGDHAGLGWTSSKHTGLPVPVYAIGVNSEAFSGNIDNTDIPRIIRETIE